MMSPPRRLPSGALILIAVGLVLLILRLGGSSSLGVVTMWWPILLIGVGLAQLLGRPPGPKWSGVLLLILGIAFLLQGVGVLQARHVTIAIPLLLLLAGLTMVVRRPR